MSDENQMVHDARLSHLYRQGAHEEPPASLDAAILSAARMAVTPARVHRPWWRAWTLPMSVAASAVVVASLALMMEDALRAPLPQEVHPPPAVTPAPAPSVHDNPVTAPESLPGAATAPAPDPVRSPAVRSSPARQRQSSSPAAARAFPAPAMPPAPPDGQAPPRQTMSSPAPAKVREAPLMRDSAAPAGADSSASPMPERAAPAGRVASDEAAPALSKPAPAVRSPQDWIESIRALKARGKQEEAARELAEFLKTYPGYPLPEDLR